LRRFFLKTIKVLFLLLFVGILLAALGLVGAYFHFSKDLPAISRLEDYRPPIITTFYSDDDRPIAELYTERRIVVPLSMIPKHLIHAFVAAEDARFYQHKGVDLHSIARAFFKNLEAGTIVQGGSTITQQVTKSFLLTPERSYRRKIKEAILAYRLDKRFSKEQILYLYLNQIYLGYGAYGVEAAAQNYFGRQAKELSLAQSAMLAGLPQAPSRYSPFRYPERAKKRQVYVLNRMVEEGFISEAEASQAISDNLNILPRANLFRENVPYYTEHVRRELLDRFGRETLYNQGLQVYTCANIEMQEMARRAIETGLLEIDKRQGYRGPIDRLPPEGIEAFSRELQDRMAETPIAENAIFQGVVIEVDDRENLVTVRIGNERGVISLADMRWARKPDPDIDYIEGRIAHPGEALAVGDVIHVRVKKKEEDRSLWALALEQQPEVQSALICMEAKTGEIKAMVGGRDFSESQFNRAIQSRRQPGSAFKPIIYAAAIDKGYTPATLIVDSPIVFKDTLHDFVWKPDNYDNTFHGFTLLRDGLIHSRNVVTVKILNDSGIGYTINYARKLGITSQLDANLSLALGASGVSLLELIRAYSVFANQGMLVPPCFIRRIVDRDGNVVFEHHLDQEAVIAESTAYIITHLLEEVVQYGTGWRVKALKRPVAGKTGTTNNLYDAWFMGYTPDYITGVWVGFDGEKSLGIKETGSRAASPIWLDFMQQTLKGKPVRAFAVPDSVVFTKIDTKTGLLPISESEHTLFECFKEGTEPTEYTRPLDTITDTNDFFKNEL
jgi:penicillin-binding protein 1A